MTPAPDRPHDESGTAIPPLPILSVVKDAVMAAPGEPVKAKAPPRAFSRADIPDDLEEW
jgi:hypothetical protein